MEKQPHHWTAEQIIVLMDERDKRYAERFSAQEKAVNVALDQTKARFENVNEWRGTVTDLLNNAMPRPEAHANDRAKDEKIAMLQSRLDRLEGKGIGVNAAWIILVAVVSISLIGLGLFLK